MLRPDSAEQALRSGINCAQAILVTYGPALGLEEPTALRLASGLNGGVGRTGEICGAVSGACMILGLAHGPADRKSSREKSAEEVGRFIDAFTARCGFVRCADLLGMPIRNADDRAKAKAAGLFETECPRFVRIAAEILEEMLPR